jgi:hypothetical protein
LRSLFKLKSTLIRIVFSFVRRVRRLPLCSSLNSNFLANCRHLPNEAASDSEGSFSQKEEGNTSALGSAKTTFCRKKESHSAKDFFLFCDDAHEMHIIELSLFLSTPFPFRVKV